MERHHPGVVLPPVPKSSKELQTAVQDDARRREVDSAKKRAAAQHVDYESFAALVSMAHVKPFERRRGQQEEAQKHVQVLPAWTFDASGELATSNNLGMSCNECDGGETNKKPSYGLSLINKTENLITKAKGNTSLPKDTVLPPTSKCSVGCYEAKCMTADAFKREWRRVGSNLQDKLKFLLALPPSDLSKMFKADLPPSILADVIDVLCWWERTSAPERLEGIAPFFPESHPEGASTHNIYHLNACGSAPQETFDVLIAFHILSSLCSCGRFSLSLKLVGTRVQSSAIHLIEQLVQYLEMKEVCEERSNNFSYMCSSKEQTISKDDLKQLADLYSLT